MKSLHITSGRRLTYSQSDTKKRWHLVCRPEQRRWVPSRGRRVTEWWHLHDPRLTTSHHLPVPGTAPFTMQIISSKGTGGRAFVPVSKEELPEGAMTAQRNTPSGKFPTGQDDLNYRSSSKRRSGRLMARRSTVSWWRTNQRCFASALPCFPIIQDKSRERRFMGAIYLASWKGPERIIISLSLHSLMGGPACSNPEVNTFLCSSRR